MQTIVFNSIGADPEVFFARRGVPISAEGLVGGTKEKPLPMVGLPEGFYVQEDNVAAEYNIPPAKTAEEFSKNVQLGLKYLKQLAKARKLSVMLLPDADFTLEEVGTPHAQRLGCDPDYNAWLLDLNPRPNPPAQMRTAAGHVHVSWAFPTKEQIITLIRGLDLFLGVPSIVATTPNRRRSLYGKAGAFRPKSYGAEYRVLDNFWLGNARYVTHVYKQVKNCINWLNVDPRAADKLQYVSEDIQLAINSHDRLLCQKLMKEFNIYRFPDITAPKKMSSTTETDHPHLLKIQW